MAAYTFSAYNLPKHFLTDPSLTVLIPLAACGFLAAAGTVPLYSMFELSSAERSLARTNDVVDKNSNLHFFQKIGKTQGKNASDSLYKKSAYTFFHSAIQGPTIGNGVIELTCVFLPELTLPTKVMLLAAGIGVSLLFSLSKNKRVFENVEESASPRPALRS
jgi:hypothetical protein